LAKSGRKEAGKYVCNYLEEKVHNCLYLLTLLRGNERKVFLLSLYSIKGCFFRGICKVAEFFFLIFWLLWPKNFETICWQQGLQYKNCNIKEYYSSRKHISFKLYLEAARLTVQVKNLFMLTGIDKIFN
jgi:hypothetical protein